MSPTVTAINRKINFCQQSNLPIKVAIDREILLWELKIQWGGEKWATKIHADVFILEKKILLQFFIPKRILVFGTERQSQLLLVTSKILIRHDMVYQYLGR